MEAISAGRKRQGKKTIGGIRAVYLAPFRKVQRSQITYDGVSLTRLPTTYVYKFELAPGTSFEQKHSDSDGGKYFDIQMSLNFNKISAFDNLNFQKLLRKDYWMVIQDNNGNYFLSGFRNGLTGSSLKTTTVQYTIDFEGQETEFAPFVNDIIGTDIIIVDGDNYVFQDNNDFYFQDDQNYIFQ